jgi:AraC-like DNA-binding protein
MFQHLQIAYGFICVASALIVSGVVLLLVIKWRNLRMARMKDEARKKQQDYVAYVIAHLDADEELKLPVGPLGKWDLAVLEEQLIELAERVKGKHRERLAELFERLGLPEKELARLTRSFGVNRLDAAYKLGAMGCSQAAPALLSVLKTERDEPGRFIIARAIARCARDTADLREMVAHMVALSPESPRLLAEILSESAVDPAPLMREWIEHSDWRLVLVAMAGMPSTANRELIGSLWKLIGADEKEVRINAAKLLLRTGDWVTPQQVESLIKHPDWEIRSLTAKSIGRWADDSYVPLLSRSIDDENWWVRYNAARSLAKLGDDGFRALCEIASQAKQKEIADLAMQNIQDALRDESAGSGQAGAAGAKTKHAMYHSYFNTQRAGHMTG